MSTLRESILSAEDGRCEPVEIAQWDATIWVHSISAAEREAWESSLQIVDGVPQITGARCRLLVKCLHDDNGNRIFGDEDADALAGKDSLIIDRLWEVANKLNTVTDAEVECQLGK